MARILIVDDDPDTSRVLASALRQHMHQVEEASSTTEAQRRLAENDYGVVFVGQAMLEGEGGAVLEALRAADPAVSVILLTNLRGVPPAGANIGHGIFDVLTKPFQAEAVRAVTWRAGERTCLLRENEQLKDTVQRLGGGMESRIEAGASAASHESSLARQLADAVGDRFDLTGILEQAEKQLILQTLTATRGAQAEAARRMGLSRSALAYKLNKYGIRTTAE
jgi:DNA-binding NtrC family response regulator